MNYPTQTQTLTVKMAVSPLQWGECPGNLRFTLFTASAQSPIGSVSIGGMAAYKLQTMIKTHGEVEATVVRGRIASQFVLTHIATETGNQPWKEAVFGKPAIKKQVIHKTVDLPASRANVEVTATRTARIAELVEA